MWEIIGKFFYIMDHRRKALAFLLLAILMNSFLETLGIGLIGPFIALVNNPNLIDKNVWLVRAYSAFDFSSKNQFILASAVFILAIFYVKSFVSFKVRQSIFLFSLSHLGELRSRLMYAYLRLPYSFHLKSNTAFLIQNIVNETETFCNGTLLQILNSTVSLVMIFALIGLLLITDPISTLAASFILFLGIALVIRFRKQLSRWGKISSQSKSEMSPRHQPWLRRT